MVITPEQRRLLTETAFLSCLLNDTKRARSILRGLDAAGVDTAIGAGLADLTDGNAAAASDRFRPLSDAGDTHASILLAVALKADGRLSEFDRLLAKQPNDSELHRLADSLR